MTRSLKWWLALGFLLVFLAGAASGFFAAARHMRTVFHGRHDGIIGHRMRAHLQRQLDLTPEQMQQINPIFERAAKDLQTIRGETAGRVSQTLERTHTDLAGHLSPDQQAKLEKMKERMKHRHLRRKHGRHRPEPPP